MNPDELEKRKILSIVSPAYNESANLDEFYSRVISATKDLNLEVEIVYVNDGSQDNTIDVMLNQRKNDKRISIIDLSRNFGKEIALTAGLDHASGDAIVIIDADLQDPPELINEFVKHWRAGYDVVSAKRSKREGESHLKKLTSYVYYRLLFLLSDINIPKDTGDFRLLDRKALEALLKLREKHRYMKGLFAWVGFKQLEIEYERDARFKGKTKWNYFSLLNLAFDGLTSFSVLPLRMASIVGVFSAMIAFLYGAFITVKTVFFGDPVAGYSSLVVIITFIGGIQLLALGIIGEYLGRIFNETKNRPLYIVKNAQSSMFFSKNLNEKSI
ncbi:MAG TPA: glycosyltransferase [Thiotrichaceae bacterium]|jgi:glycosyltransferase involved in cell wall biosynthesis|nr:glycosyltransferase [Thiotrichaceae bacterium]HIM08094.1 glycosyltransferase [Gammaproteobacteria bacterium]